MKLIFHRGKKNKGCLIEMLSLHNRIFIDYGQQYPFNDFEEDEFDIEGLTKGKPNVDGFFFLNCTSCNVGLYKKILPEIPVYMTDDEKKLLKCFEQQKKGSELSPQELELIDRMIDPLSVEYYEIDEGYYGWKFESYDEFYDYIYNKNCQFNTIKLFDMAINPQIFSEVRLRCSLHLFVSTDVGKKYSRGIYTSFLDHHSGAESGNLPKLIVRDGRTSHREQYTDEQFREYVRYVGKYKYVFLLSAPVGALTESVPFGVNRLYLCDDFQEKIIQTTLDNLDRRCPSLHKSPGTLIDLSEDIDDEVIFEELSSTDDYSFLEDEDYGDLDDSYPENIGLIKEDDTVYLSENITEEKDISEETEEVKETEEAKETNKTEEVKEIEEAEETNETKEVKEVEEAEETEEINETEDPEFASFLMDSDDGPYGPLMRGRGVTIIGSNYVNFNKYSLEEMKQNGCCIRIRPEEKFWSFMKQFDKEDSILVCDLEDEEIEKYKDKLNDFNWIKYAYSGRPDLADFEKPQTDNNEDNGWDDIFNEEDEYGEYDEKYEEDEEDEEQYNPDYLIIHGDDIEEYKKIVSPFNVTSVEGKTEYFYCGNDNEEDIRHSEQVFNALRFVAEEKRTISIKELTKKFQGVSSDDIMDCCDLRHGFICDNFMPDNELGVFSCTILPIYVAAFLRSEIENAESNFITIETALEKFKEEFAEEIEKDYSLISDVCWKSFIIKVCRTRNDIVSELHVDLNSFTDDNVYYTFEYLNGKIYMYNQSSPYDYYNY